MWVVDHYHFSFLVKCFFQFLRVKGPLIFFSEVDPIFHSFFQLLPGLRFLWSYGYSNIFSVMHEGLLAVACIKRLEDDDLVRRIHEGSNSD